MRKRWRALSLISLVILLFAGVALADTGGSMGGGDWGGGGGGDSGGGYSGGGGYSSGGGGGGWSSSSSSDWSSSDSSSSSGSGNISLGGLLVFAILGGGFLLVVWAIDRSHSTSSFTFASTQPDPVYGTDVSVLRVAIDGRARKFVQAELARIAKTADTATAEGRATMLREVALMLRKLRDAWIYGGAVNHPIRTNLMSAKHEFDKAVGDARSRFREEVIRNADGTVTTRAASEYTPRSDEGAGVILVSIILAARRELFTVQHIGDGDDLRRALEGASQLTPNNLVAIEIVWQPAEDRDRLSTMELEAKYPRPDLIPISGALVGKTFCDYCAGPFPAELVSCPHCGAPAPGRDSSRAA